MIDIFKVKTGIAPELMKGVFEFADVPYNLRNQSRCSPSIPCTEKYGIETASPIVQDYGTKFQQKLKTPNLLSNLKYKLRVGFPKTVHSRYVNCSLNM